MQNEQFVFLDFHKNASLPSSGQFCLLDGGHLGENLCLGGPVVKGLDCSAEGWEFESRLCQVFFHCLKVLQF